MERYPHYEARRRRVLPVSRKIDRFFAGRAIAAPAGKKRSDPADGRDLHCAWLGMRVMG